MLSSFILALVVNLAKSQSQKTTVWSETFTKGVPSTSCQCQSWVAFWQFWIGDPSQVVSITLGGSISPTTYTCSGSAAQFIAFALATPPFEITQVTCESGIWFTGHLAWYPSGNAIGVSASPIPCSSIPVMRPCWTSVNWGGMGNTTCSAPNQTFTVTVVSNVPTPVVQPGSVTWTDSFEYLVDTTSTQCDNWRQFWQNTVPRGNTLSVTLTSDINGGVSATCSGPGVNLLATALFTPTSNGQYHCNEGTVWYFNGLNGSDTNTSAIQIGGQPVNCTAELALRPCWVHPYESLWGGFGGVNCNATSQTFTATVTIETTTIANTCWHQVDLQRFTGILSISCNSTLLQCDSTCTAAGYEPSSSGLYMCDTSANWSPAVPTCNVITTTSTTTTSTTSSTTTSTTTTTPTTTSTSTTSTTTPTTTSTTKTSTTTSTTSIAPTTTSTTTTTTTTPPNVVANVPTMYNLPMIATKTTLWWWPFLLGSILVTLFAAVVSTMRFWFGRNTSCFH